MSQENRAPRRRRRRKNTGRAAGFAMLYIVCVIGVSVLLSALCWIAANDVLALNKPEHTATVVLSEDYFSIKKKEQPDGTTKTTFNPNGTLTRGMFVTVLGRMAGVDAANYAIGTAKEEVFWLDLQELGAPADWNGKTYVSVFWNLVTPDRNLQAEILETSDELPAGVEKRQIFFVRGGKVAEVKKVKLPQTSGKIAIDGKGNDQAWAKALKFDEFYLLNAAGMRAPQTSVKLIRDQKFLYVFAEFTEDSDNGFTIDKGSKPWYNDGLEIYIRTRDSKTAYVQYILALAEKSHQEKVSGLQVGAPRQNLENIEYKVVVNGKKAYIEAAIPLKLFGTGNATSGFNIGRNRMRNGNLEPYSIAGGRGYLNFNAFELIW